MCPFAIKAKRVTLKWRVTLHGTGQYDQEESGFVDDVNVEDKILCDKQPGCTCQELLACLLSLSNPQDPAVHELMSAIVFPKKPIGNLLLWHFLMYPNPNTPPADGHESCVFVVLRLSIM